ncbi:MAG: hypothetical protein GY928_08340 [Colwellia sp.]|nr:hypothetical protein [Colwellia sp.]
MMKHRIRSKDGGTKDVMLTAIKSIRCHCLECVSWSAYEVKNCSSPLCPLFPYRMGKVPGHKGKGRVGNFKEI